MPDQNFSPEQSLQLIGSMINKAKGRFSENGHLYLLWGWAVLICSVAQFILMNVVKLEQHYLVWMTMWLVFIYQVVYLARRKKKEKIKTYTDEIMAAVWISFVIMMLLFGFLFGRIVGKDYYEYINPAFLALYGMPTVLSGAILKFRPLIIGGICCWLLSVAAAFITYDYQLLILGGAVILAWIIPGYLLRSKYQKLL
jgi:hypothetical protein